jgi:acetyltransferase-like isoleucine patch superfamily enzyme
MIELIKRRVRAYLLKLRFFFSIKNISFKANLMLGKSSHLLLDSKSKVMKYGFVTVLDNSTFQSGKNLCICQGCEIILTPGAKLIIQNDVYIGSHSNIRCSGIISIGNNVRIAQNVSIIDSNYNLGNGIIGELSPNSVIIEDDVWIATGSIILPGVVISRGAVIGAGSVVTKNIDAYTLWAGNPAKWIKNI